MATTIPDLALATSIHFGGKWYAINGAKDLGEKQKKRDQALQDRRDIVERKVKQLNEAVDENMLGRERDWQNRVNGWVLKAQRKIKAKEADDKAKAEKEMERKKRRRMRK